MPTVDLSKDIEAQIGSSHSFTERQLAEERVITKVFTRYAIPLEISDNIRTTFKSKLWRLGKSISGLGGTQRHKLLQKWEETVWSFTINPREMSRQLISRKRQVEKQLQHEVSKRQKIESVASSLKYELKSLKKVSQDQAATIVSLKTGQSKQGRGTSSKRWSEYSRPHQRVMRKSLISGVQAALSACDTKCFSPVSVEVKNIETGKHETIDLDKGTFTRKQCSTNTMTDDDLTHFALYCKDRFSLSDATYREISQLTTDLPRLYKLKELTKDMNSQFEILPSPSGTIGVQQSLKARLLVRLGALSLKDGEIIQIKLTGDGTNIAKSIHVVNFAFTLLNEESIASSPFGNHSLAILQGPEDYNALATSLSDIVKEASELQSIEIDGKEHNIEYFLGGDLKFLAIVCGIEAANAKYACIWCKCASGDRWDMSKDWSAFEASKGARTTDEIEKHCKLSKSKCFSCCEVPIFKFIPIDHVIIDTLHLFLRVSDLLINLLIQDLRRQDGIANATLNREKQ